MGTDQPEELIGGIFTLARFSAIYKTQEELQGWVVTVTEQILDYFRLYDRAHTALSHKEEIQKFEQAYAEIEVMRQEYRLTAKAVFDLNLLAEKAQPIIEKYIEMINYD